MSDCPLTTARFDAHPFTVEIRDASTSTRVGRQVDIYWTHDGAIAFSFNVPDDVADAIVGAVDAR